MGGGGQSRAFTFDSSLSFAHGAFVAPYRRNGWPSARYVCLPVLPFLPHVAFLTEESDWDQRHLPFSLRDRIRDIALRISISFTEEPRGICPWATFPGYLRLARFLNSRS